MISNIFKTHVTCGSSYFYDNPVSDDRSRENNPIDTLLRPISIQDLFRSEAIVRGFVRENLGVLWCPKLFPVHFMIAIKSNDHPNLRFVHFSWSRRWYFAGIYSFCSTIIDIWKNFNKTALFTLMRRQYKLNDSDIRFVGKMIKRWVFLN